MCVCFHFHTLTATAISTVGAERRRMGKKGDMEDDMVGGNVTGFVREGCGACEVKYEVIKKVALCWYQ